MNQPLTIALDAMGGDDAPAMVIKGANIARERHPLVHFLMVGDERRIAPVLDSMAKLKAVTTIVHTEEAIGNDTKPSAALRGGRRSSMGLAIEAVHQARAAGMVSAGNTGALMAISKFVLKTVPGIDRPAIASFFPTMRGESVMLDLGANIVCDSNNLVQFAVMGEVFARTVLGLTRPSIGLLNVGAEDLKGHDEIRAASARLRGTNLPIKFHGFIEGNDIPEGTVDVIVTDGFTGNIALKMAEGTVRLYSRFLRAAFTSTLMARLGYLFARFALNRVKDRLDPRHYNGAMFLGLNGIVVKSHGGTDALGFANAIGVAIDMAVNHFNDKIRGEIERLHAVPAESPAAAV